MSANPHCPLPTPSVLFGRHSRFSSALRFDRSSLNGTSSVASDGSRNRLSLGASQQHVFMHVSLQRKGLRDSDIRDFVQWLSASLQQQLRQFPPVGRSAPLLPGGAAGAGPNVSSSAPAVSGAKPATGLSKGERGENDGAERGGAEDGAVEPLSPFLFTCCLDVSENFITADGLSHLLGFFQAHPSSFRLAKLKLYKNRLGDAGARVLAAFIQPASPLPASSSSAASGAFASSSASLRTSKSVGNPPAARAGKPTAPPPALEELHLSHCDITAKGCLCLLEAVAAVMDDKGRHLYPRYDQVRRSLVPLWLRLEYNNIHDPLGLLKQWSANLKGKRSLPSPVPGAASSSNAPLSFACFAEKLPLSSGGGRAGAGGANALSAAVADSSGAYFHCTPARCCRATSTCAPILHVYMITHQSSGVAAATPTASSSTVSSLGTAIVSNLSEAGSRRQGGSTAPGALPALIGAHPNSAALSRPPGAETATAQGRRRSFGAGPGTASAAANSAGQPAGGASQQPSRRGSSGGKKQSQQARGRARSSSGGTDARAGASGTGSAKGAAGGDQADGKDAGEASGRQRPAAGGGRGDEARERDRADAQSGACGGRDGAAEERRSGEKVGSRDRRDLRGSTQAGGEKRNGGREEPTALGDKTAAGDAAGRTSPSAGVEIDKAEVGRCLPLYIFLDASAVLQMADRKENEKSESGSSLFLSFNSLKMLCKEQLIVHRGRSSVSPSSGRTRNPLTRSEGLFADAPESDLTLLLVVDAVQQELLGLSRGSFLGSSENLSLGEPRGRRGIDALEQLHTLATDFCLVEYVGCVQQPQPAPAWARPEDQSRQTSDGRREDGRNVSGGRNSDRGDGKGKHANSRKGNNRESENMEFLLEDDDREEGNDFACLTSEEVAVGQRDANLSVHTLKTIDYALLWKAHLEEVSLHADPDRDTSDLMFFITANPAVDAFIRQIAPLTMSRGPGRQRDASPRAKGPDGSTARAFLPCLLLQEFSLAVARHIETRNVSVERTGQSLNEDGSASWRPPPLTAADFRLAGASLLRKEQDSRRGYLPAAGSSRLSAEAFLGPGTSGAGTGPNEVDLARERAFVGFPSLADRARERRSSSIGRQGGGLPEGAAHRRASGDERHHGSSPKLGGFGSLETASALGLLPHERDGEYPTFLPPLIGTGFTNEAFLRESSGSRDQLLADSVFGSPLSGPGSSNSASRACDSLRGRGSSSLTHPPALAALLCSAGGRNAAGSGGAMGERGSAVDSVPLAPALAGSRHGLCSKVMTVAELEEMQLKMRRQQAEAEAASLERFVGPGPRGLGGVEENGRNAGQGGGEASERSPFLLASGGNAASDDNAGDLFGVGPHALGQHGRPAGPLADAAARGVPFDAGEAASSLAAAMLPLLQRNSRLGGAGDRGLGEDGNPAEEDFLLRRCGSSREKLLQSHGSGSHSSEVVGHGRDAGCRGVEGPGLSEVEIKCELIDAIAIVQELSSRVRLLWENNVNQGGNAHGGRSAAGDALMKEDLLRRAQDCVTRWRQLLLVASKQQVEEREHMAVGRGNEHLALPAEWQGSVPASQAHAGLSGATGPSSGRGERSLSEGSQSGLAGETGVSSGSGPAVVLPPLQMQQARPRGAPSLPPPRCWVSPAESGDQSSPPLHHPWRPQPELSGPPSLFSQQAAHAWGSGEGVSVRGSGGASGRGHGSQEDPRGMLGLHPSLQWRPEADRDCGPDGFGTDEDAALQPGALPSPVPRSLLPLQRHGAGLQGILPPGVVGGAGPNSGTPGGCPTGPAAGAPRAL
ncbi:conserved hypothetical protein [Neospora caninum Liverpool]|uniref:Leucine rich repeat protein n=1 Tax=Neospora caninum (strain Liverpool) TaxID=572307 RepID=F0VNE6_NEOCL|nr:conserved hypothetical protein [Neospora caninum Liverpool]CBZ55242.1 conserved hypothetical protein [Neospora caninum Liverpool]CEL69971.1 TPA: hypothetical protein BN1204_056660 [Neospora caninum Liverpool]|eukprot:XP_003885270.1 conserved hypothetical protein [Neospora caninum Liverpool]